MIVLFLLLPAVGCHAQENNDGLQSSDDSKPEYIKMPKDISSSDTSAGWSQEGTKLLITGVVYHPDSKTPAPGVVIYYYQTNTEGRYIHDSRFPNSMPPNSMGHTHGYIRGWVKSDAAGRYNIYTIRPGAYPTGDEPAHIHLTIMEHKDSIPYYIDDIVFDDDPLMSTARRLNRENRGGSGIVRLAKSASLWVGERDIFLGRNIPGSHHNADESFVQGPQIGEDVISFIPFHAWGPDKGTRACPVCKYGWYHGILFFTTQNPNDPEIETWLRFFERESTERGTYLKVYYIYGNPEGYSKAKRIAELENLGQSLNLSKVALTFVPSFEDKESEVYLNKINSESKNTVLIFRRSKVIGKMMNAFPGEKSFQEIRQILNETSDTLFYIEK